jgi:hypothetical protein
VPLAAYPHRQTKRGRERRGQPRQAPLVRSAFIATMPSGLTGVFIRRGPERRGRSSRGSRAKGFLVRYADDAVFGFSSEEDARRVLAMLGKRFGRYGLTLHPDKTHLVRLRSPNGRV